ncbi:MAG TPA: GntR family transcriptional regulator [Anaerolineales bacterium]|nr:GntR family transcriptional regulator [Anaerolineales bacterium]
MLASALDKDSPIPLYVQLARRLEGLIAEGALPVGARLPGEEELARRYDLNRHTVRHALALLVQYGVVHKARGVGSFVRRGRALTPVHSLDRMTSFIDDFELGNVQVEDTILTKVRLPATPDLASRLRLPPRSSLVCIERLRLADSTPFVLERQYYDFRVFGRLLELDIRGSMYQLLVREFRADLHHSVQTLQAVRPPDDVARRLRLPGDTPCMFLESVAYTSDDRPLEVLRSYYRGDRYTFRVETGSYRPQSRPAEPHAG